MKANKTFFRFFLVLCMILISGCAHSQDKNPCMTGGQTGYFGVEINNILCGYSVETTCKGKLDGRDVIYENSDVTLKMTLLGAGIDIAIKSLYCIDPLTGEALLIDLLSDMGKSQVHSETKVINDTAFFISYSSGIKKAVHVDDDVLICSPARYPYLLKDFRYDTVQSIKYRVYEPMKGEVVERSYRKIREEDLILGDSLFHTVVFEETDLVSGMKAALWLNRDDGYNVRALIAGRCIFYADESVMGKIQLADMNKVLLTRVNKVIPDFQNMTWLKVKARVNTYGEIVTQESLNNHWQKFTGTVEGSLVEGVFETAPVRYNGLNAPPFPPAFPEQEGMEQYLLPELMIESDDPLIISEAKKITSGSSDSWEASVRLSKWVSENIKGALPGGGSAINTLRTAEAECGGHSRLLVAFCRAVGIPARLSIGCVYVPYYNGSFGQHAWTEIYMGDAGWISVDATLHETDYISAGHIRFGEKATFQPEAMEIIDYRIK